MMLTAEDLLTGSGVRTLTDPLVNAARLDGDQPAMTFVDYEASKDGVAWSLTRAEMHRKIRAVAVWLSDRCEPGDRVPIVAEQGLDYVVGFLGAVHAGMVAVPLFTPAMQGHHDRLANVLDDCAPSCVLTAKVSFDQVREFLRDRGGNLPCLAVDTLPESVGDDYVRPHVGTDDLAYLQYTSGSTRTPAGVKLTHGNALSNARHALEAFAGDEPNPVTVSWLPLFHDMGLMLAVLAPTVGAIPSVLMDPVAFLQRPERWLRQLTANPNAITAAPNFAYDFCVSRISDAEKAWLRLDHALSVANGSEPVHPATVTRFNETFAECGMRPESVRSSYGLAEGTLFVSTSTFRAEPKVVAFDRDQLGKGIATARTDPSAPTSELVSCGNPTGQHVAIVDPVTFTALHEGEVGEIWVNGPNTGLGYWGWDDAASAEIFHAALAEPVAGLPDTGWLRTGDLGAYYEGELFVTGRMKDLIIVDGRNHYPQDVEETVEAAHRGIRKHHTAAFGVTRDGAERLVVVAEYSRKLTEDERDPAEIGRAVSAAVSSAHGMAPYDVLLVEPDVVPHTSSGKVARRLCRERYLDSELTGEAGPTGRGKA